ncbi:anti-sigma factor [Sphingomonas sp. MA1305]|uniref:anti-sigma factor n=1 Tax=Sphingomonas sp. MA1305 TaxID=2479204 RepID=UPI0018DF69C9|nr:anti-sigma factor [Sphingomonas sp. MA1305]MBI0476432.1 anti-sigma factor [Sphingomonas sp. MA1305]
MTTPDDPDMTAAELALGVLEGEERAAANRRLLADPVFARDVARWRAHFATLFAEVPEVAPPPQLEERILAALDPAQDRDAVRTLRRWRWFGGGMSAVAAALLVTLLTRPAALPPRPAPRPDAPLVATLAPGEATSIAAVYDRAAGQVRTIGRMAVPTDRDAELWAIGRDGVPRALGLLHRDGRTQIVVRGVTIDQTTTLAVSIEPIGGSPGPLPTGPVVATGQLSMI